MNPVVVKLLLGGLEESGHKMITDVLWSAALVEVTQGRSTTGKECIVKICLQYKYFIEQVAEVDQKLLSRRRKEPNRTIK